MSTHTETTKVDRNGPWIIRSDAASFYVGIVGVFETWTTDVQKARLFGTRSDAEWAGREVDSQSWVVVSFNEALASAEDR